MTRRDFLKVMAAGSLTLITRRAFPLDLTGTADVGIVKGTQVEAAVRRAVDLAGGIRRFVKPGDVVVVKPNIAWNSPPALKANTDPVVVRTLVHLCFEALAAKVYVFDRTTSNARLSYVTSGIQKAAEEAGAKVLFVDEVSSKLYKSVTVPGGVFLKETQVNKYVLESDVLINAPVAKQHSSAGLTLGMKNLMGITGDNRSGWHLQLHEAISDINLAVKSHLTVIDATSIMVRNGPTGGSPDFLLRKDTIIASANVAQADAEAAGLFGVAARELRYLRLAQAKGIGTITGFSRKEVTL